MSGQFTPEERARVIELNDRLMQDATGAAVVIVGLESQKAELVKALAFARSVILGGEPWSETCEQIIDGALGLDRDFGLREATNAPPMPPVKPPRGSTAELVEAAHELLAATEAVTEWQTEPMSSLNSPDPWHEENLRRSERHANAHVALRAALAAYEASRK